MAFKPNYNFQKGELSRAKAQKKQEKLKRMEEETAKRKAAQRGGSPADSGEMPTDLPTSGETAKDDS